MSSTYRDDLGAAGERLAELEASHVERELQRLRELRAQTASAQAPPPPTLRERMAPIVAAIVSAWWIGAFVANGLSAALRYLVLGALLLGVGYAAVLFLTGSPLYGRWRHRRHQRKELAKIDAEIAILDSAGRTIEVSALEDVRVRIAELEAEEASSSSTKSSMPPSAARRDDHGSHGPPPAIAPSPKSRSSRLALSRTTSRSLMRSLVPTHTLRALRIGCCRASWSWPRSSRCPVQRPGGGTPRARQ